MAAEFTPQQIARLASMIGMRFSTVEQLRHAVTLGLQASLDTYTLAPNLTIRILELCQKVNAQSRIADLIVGLKQVNPHQQFAANLDAFLAGTLSTAATVCGTLLVTEQPPLPIVNRRNLRSHLSQIISLNSGYQAISISGPSASGKTHSKELILFVAKCVGVTSLHVNVMANDTKPRTLLNVVEQIALKVQPGQFAATLVADQPTDAQLAERFVSWLSGLSQNFEATGNRYWITFDGLDRAVAEPMRELLIPQLLRAIADGNLQNVKLFLLGDNGKRVRDARRIVLHEEAQPLTAVDIGTFLQEYAATQGWQLTQTQIDEAIRFIIANAVWPFDHQTMEEIRDRLELSIDKLLQGGE
jgi:hypothetical protein